MREGTSISGKDWEKRKEGKEGEERAKVKKEEQSPASTNFLCQASDLQFRYKFKVHDLPIYHN